jgi:hypothetical protein
VIPTSQTLQTLLEGDAARVAGLAEGAKVAPLVVRDGRDGGPASAAPSYLSMNLWALWIDLGVL